MNATISRRSLITTACACGALAFAGRFVPAARAEEAAAEAALTAPAPSYSVAVYDFGAVRVHAFNTCDALGDVCYIVEGADALVGIELPPLEATLPLWSAYVQGLGKPMADIWVDAHANGANYIEGMNVWGTQGAVDAIAGGSTYSTATGLAETFGDAWNSNFAQINNVVEAGPVSVAGIDFEVIDRGDTYDLVVVAANAVYTHMLGATTHSIVMGADAAAEMIGALKGYQEAGYTLVLPVHSMPEGPEAVGQKIAYLEQLVSIAEGCTDAAGFTAAVQEAFPGYDGDSYLAMTAAAFFPEA